VLAAGSAPQTSVIQRLHPLAKLATAGSLTVASLMLNNPATLGLILLFFLAILLLGRVRLTLRGALGLLLLLGMVGLGNFWASADPAEAAKYSLRFAIFVLGVPVCAATTAPRSWPGLWPNGVCPRPWWSVSCWETTAPAKPNS